ncbi:MAG: DeoR/GlpR family DNA-binding transcription regulator, partial [Treponema sp.]|nr:DeoR/GlpR family DNA-binding transcription regulator [Treponema sp.]
MFQIERQEKILTYITESKKANTGELASIFAVSKVTIRRDIDMLAGQGLLIKTHGGAVSIKGTLLREIPFYVKAGVNADSKKAIGAAAARLIENGDIVILDSGSTTLEIAKHITKNDITVITNDIKVAMELTGKSGVQVVVSGGTLDSSVYTLLGAVSSGFFKNIRANKTFLGCDAVDMEFGVSDRTFESVNVKRAMIHAADEVIMVTDSSKLNKRVFTHLCDISEINKL